MTANGNGSKRGPDVQPRRSRRSKVSQDAQLATRSISSADVAVEINGLYVLDGRLVRLDRSASDGRLFVQDQIDGTERCVPAGMLSARAIESSQVVQTDSVVAIAQPERDAADGPSIDATKISPLTEAQKAIALKRLNVIQPLADQSTRTELDVVAVAHQTKLSPRTVYRWLCAYLEGGLSALAPRPRGVSKGAVLLDARIDQIIDSTIQEAFDAEESAATVSDLLPAIHAKCDRLGVKYPGEATVQRRLTPRRRNYRNLTGEARHVQRERHRPVTGSVDAEYALHIVEIDHTVMDIHAVDDETFEPIGRPTFTVAIDDFTRCVLGFFLTLLPPSALAAALCLQRMRFPKEAWLKSIEYQSIEWPMYGAPGIVQTDHGAEFVAPAFAYGCRQMGTEPRTRPAGQPRYGGTIERLIGTLMRKLRLLPGSTYNDMLKRATRQPIRDARYTLAGLEWEIVRQIALYHDQRHDALGITPRQAWDKALAAGERLAPALPGISPELFVIEFMPLIERGVDRKGVRLSGGRFYWAEELRPLVHLRETIFARPDPRDVRHLWLRMPDQHYVRSRLYQPRNFTGVTEWDFQAWRAQRRGPKVLNHAVHAALLDESRERRAQAAASVKAQRNEAKTVTQSRRRAVQNRIFQQEYRAREPAEEPFDLSNGPPLATPDKSTNGQPGRPRLAVVRTTPDEPDLSRLKATPGFVFRRNPRQR